MIRFAVILTCLVLTGCGAAPATEMQSVDPGAEVTLAPGATVSVKNASIEVRFVAVTEDSRCPRDVTCIWAGEVKVQLEIHASMKGASQLEILEGGSMVAGEYRVTLVRVEPQPMSTARIAPQDYRATLKIDNLLDSKYESFGVLGDPHEVFPEFEDPRFLGAGPPLGAWVGVRATF